VIPAASAMTATIQSAMPKSPRTVSMSEVE
jgi:hypothetical protein